MKLSGVVVGAFCWVIGAAASQEGPIEDTVNSSISTESGNPAAQGKISKNLKFASKGVASPRASLRASLSSLQNVAEVIRTKDLGARIELVEDTLAGLVAIRDRIHSMEPTGEPWLDETLEETKSQVDQFLEIAPEVVGYMQESLEEQRQHREKLASPHEKQRSLGEDEAKSKAPSVHDAADPKIKHRTKLEPPSCKSNHGQYARSHHHVAKHFEGDTKASHRHRKLVDMQNAILGGDHAHLSKMVGSMRGKMNRGQGSRRLSDSDAKAKQCHLLTKCAKDFSYYDTIVFFYSDDIDPATGEIDDSIFHFDEKHLAEKHSDIHTVASRLWGKNGDNPALYKDDPYTVYSCAVLMQHFHRNVEWEGVPHWEGGTVSQVCLAQGSQVFIRFDEMAKKLGSYYATHAIDEMFKCADDIQKRIVPAEQPFPFQPLNSGDPYYKFTSPGGLNMANRKTSGQIQSLSQPLYTSAGNLREQIGQQAVAIAKLYRHIYDETTQKSRGDVMTFPRNYQDWEFKNILSESAFNYFQADEAIRMIQFGLDGRTPNYQPKGGFLSSCKRYLYDAIGLGLSEAGYLPDRSDGCIQDDEVEEAAENAMDQLIKPYLNLFKAVQKGYDLVFGDKTSMGFLCGMSEIIKKKGYSKWPGTCCLSAPFENVDGTWGRNHDCNTQCQVPGPVLAGLSEESCSANGGTWCPRPADCRILQECVQSAYDDAEANGKLAFALYLEPGLVEDPLYFGNCSHSREYFGYDELYTNGEDVCENVLQLHNNENFAFLDEFFNQGSGVTSGCGGNVEFEALKPPDRSRSESTGVQTGEKWEKADFSMNVIMDTTEALMEAAAAIKCPDDVTGAAQTSCAAMLNVYYPVIQIVYTAIRATFAISAFTRENLAEESYEEAMVSVEDISAVYDNMEAMNGNLEKLYNGLNTEIQTQCGSRRRQLADLSGADDELDVGAELLALKRQNEAMASEASALNSKLDDVNSKLDMQQKQMTLLQNMLQDVMIAVKKGEGVTPEAEARVSY